MKSKKQIRNLLVRCDNVRGYGMSLGRCPAEKGRRKGCCAECSMPSTLRWVLDEDVKPSANAQDELIERLGAYEQDEG